MISFLIRTSMRLKGCSSLMLILGLKVCEAGDGAECLQEPVDLRLGRRRRID